MALTSMTAVIYLSAFVGILFGNKPKFVVTQKGGERVSESIATFKIHLYWMSLLSFAVLLAFIKGHTHPAMMVWVGMQAVLCLIPVALAVAANWSESKFGLSTVKNYLNIRETTHV